MFQTNTFSVWDYVVFGGVLAVSAAIGIYYGCTGGKQKTTAEFLMADRKMHVIPVTLSLLASFMSAITLLGTPAEIYMYGTQYWMIWIGYGIMIPMATHIFIPVFYDLELTSVFEYLQMRFGTAVRIFACLCFIVQMILYMAIVLYTPCLALSVVTGFNKWISVLLVGIVCTFYTTIGGMKAVMWTDSFQICMMFAGLIAVLVKGSIDEGGFGNIWKYLEEGDRVEFWDVDPSPLKRHSLWALIFGGCFTWLAVYGVNQAMVQRTLCVPRKKDGQIAMWLNFPGLTALLTVCALCGMVVYAQYRFCDPILMKRIEAKDQLLPQYVMDQLFYPGLPGLFTACLFSGALSTISSGLNSLAAVTLQDLIRDRCCKKLSDKTAAIISKIIAFSYGLLMIALSYVASKLGGVLQAALGLFGMIGGPVLGLFTLGIMYPWANHVGAFIGTAVSLIVTLWIGLGAQVYKPKSFKPAVSTAGCLLNSTYNYTTSTTEMMTSYFNVTEEPTLSARDKPGYLVIYEVSYLWYSTIAMVITIVVGLLVSACTGCNKPSKVNPKLIAPFIYTICCLKEERAKYEEDFEEETKRGYPDSEDVLRDVEITVENGIINPGADFSKSDAYQADVLHQTRL